MILLKVIGFAAIALPFLARGALVWDTREIKLQARASEREIVANFRFRNAGSAPVAVVDIVSSCDCTRTELSRRVYAPGDEGNLTATVALRVQSGAQEETIAVMTDDSRGEPIILRVHAEIQPLIEVSPKMLVWRTGAEPKENYTLVTAATPVRISSLTIARTHPAGVATARVETVTPGVDYRIWVRPDSTAKAANFAISCSAKLADGAVQDIVVYGMTKK